MLPGTTPAVPNNNIIIIVLITILRKFLEPLDAKPPSPLLSELLVRTTQRLTSEILPPLALRIIGDAPQTL